MDIKKVKNKKVNKCLYCQKVSLAGGKGEVYILYGAEKGVLCKEIICRHCGISQYLPIAMGTKPQAKRMLSIVNSGKLAHDERVLKIFGYLNL